MSNLIDELINKNLQEQIKQITANFIIEKSVLNNKIIQLETLARNLNDLNKLKYDDYKNNVKKELENEIETFKIIANSLDEQKKSIEDKLSEVKKINEKNIELKKKIKERHEEFCEGVKITKKKLDNKFRCLDYLLEKHEVECAVCYQRITVSNLYNPGCHNEHIICLDCSHMIDKKCPLCRKQFESNTDDKLETITNETFFNALIQIIEQETQLSD